MAVLDPSGNPTIYPLLDCVEVGDSGCDSYTLPEHDSCSPSMRYGIDFPGHFNNEHEKVWQSGIGHTYEQTGQLVLPSYAEPPEDQPPTIGNFVLTGFGWQCSCPIVDRFVITSKEYQLMGDPPHTGSHKIWNIITGKTYIYISFDDTCEDYPLNPPGGSSWDESNGGHILVKDTCQLCLNISTTSIYEDRIIYNINLINEGVGLCPLDSYTIYLSYVGSTAVNGVDFIGPTVISIPYGHLSASFTVDVLNTSSNKSIKINGTGTSSFGVYLPNCGDTHDIIGENIENIENIPSINDYLTCCDFVPKDFIKWSYGDGMNQLIPPNRR